MATIEQLSSALVKADAAGNTDDAKVFADALRALKANGRAQAPSAAPPAPTADTQPTDFADQLSAGFTSGVKAIPIAGPWAMDRLNELKAGIHGVPVETIQAENQTWEGANPIAATTGTVAGTVLPFAGAGLIPGVGRALGMTGGLASRATMGGISGAAISAADTKARGGSNEEAYESAKLGGGIGAAFPIAARALSGIKSGVVNTLRGSAAATDDTASHLLKDTGSQMFESSKAAGVRVAPQAYENFAVNTVRKISSLGLDKTLHSDTWAALENILGRRGKEISLSELHIVRQIAQDASMGTLKRDASKAGQIVDEIDGFIRTLKPSDLVAGQGGAKEATNGLLEGISTWAKASRTATVETALAKAANSATGLENGIRNEFRALLKNQKIMRGFSAEERALMEGVVQGSVLANLTKLVGKFGFGRGAATNMMGGTIGGSLGFAAGGPIGTILTTLAATGARKASETITERGAQRVLNRVSGGASPLPPGAPQVAANALRTINAMPRPALVAPAAPALMLERRKPVEITVGRGR